MARFINDTLKILWPLGGNDEKVLLMLTDAAPGMVKTGEYLKVFYINIIHVTCTAHMLNRRIAEKVKDMHPSVNELISNLKKVFLIAPSRIEIYKDILPGVLLPSAPVLTRWVKGWRPHFHI